MACFNQTSTLKVYCQTKRIVSITVSLSYSCGQIYGPLHMSKYADISSYLLWLCL